MPDGADARAAKDEEAWIRDCECRLRTWFTRDADRVTRQIDGLDIGWGGVQRWATAKMPAPDSGPHLDLACGYATFLAQLGWRFPTVHLVGLNVDFEGPHVLARPLLVRAGVPAALVRADAQQMPFGDGSFASVSCFLGLQDIAIGYGEPAVQRTVDEAVRVLGPDGVLVLLDELSFQHFDALLDGLPVEVEQRAERLLDVRWNRHVAERAIRLYAEGYVVQARVEESAEQRQVYEREQARMKREMERQLTEQGYYVPAGPVRMLVARKL